MSRKKLLTLVVVLAVFATACTDIMGPRHDDPPPKCPITSGGGTCD